MLSETQTQIDIHMDLNVVYKCKSCRLLLLTNIQSGVPMHSAQPQTLPTSQTCIVAKLAAGGPIPTWQTPGLAAAADSSHQ